MSRSQGRGNSFMQNIVSRFLALFSSREEEINTDSRSNKLTIFLLGTLQPQSSLRILRGRTDVLRIIWIYACGEWWSLHFQRFNYPTSVRGEIILNPNQNEIVDLRELEGFSRTIYMDAPAAIVASNLSFPPPRIHNSQPLYVNMMPFNIYEPEKTLPTYLQGYIPLITACTAYQKPLDRNKKHSAEDVIAYLTVDERPAASLRVPQRRGGVHVESPGALRNKEIADKSQFAPNLSFYHHWGMGLVEKDYIMGGIFLASNMDQTTAVWNMRIHDTYGDIIAPHGSLERCREYLGPPDHLLQAGELLWISDRTPHESLPVTTLEYPRQFFRLVVGKISYWFAEHNTANPLSVPLPSSVTVIQGNKFTFTKAIPIIWECGAHTELVRARQDAKLRNLLYQYQLGFLADGLCKAGYNTIEALRIAGQKNKLESVVQESLSYYSVETQRYAHTTLWNALWQMETRMR